MTISRMQQPRQLYGLGSFVKSIKKGVKGLTGGIKDFIGSDAGKLALLAGASFIPFGASNASLFSRFAGSPIGQGLGSFFKGKAGSKLLDIGTDVAVGSLVGGALDYFDRKNLPESPELKGGRTAEEIAEIEAGLRDAYRNLGYSEGEIDLLVEQNMREYRSQGGRIGFDKGSNFDKYSKKGIMSTTKEESSSNIMSIIKEARENPTPEILRELEKIIPEAVEEIKIPGMEDQQLFKLNESAINEFLKGRDEAAEGGRISYAMGTDEKVEMASGIEGIPINVNPEGVKELDFRKTGGFVPPVGVKEKADDIPAMLSNNEFVFTADAVRAAGGGDIDKGAQRMYNTMKKLESKVA